MKPGMTITGWPSPRGAELSSAAEGIKAAMSRVARIASVIIKKGDGLSDLLHGSRVRVVCDFERFAVGHNR